MIDVVKYNRDMREKREKGGEREFVYLAIDRHSNVPSMICTARPLHIH